MVGANACGRQGLVWPPAQHTELLVSDWRLVDSDATSVRTGNRILARKRFLTPRHGCRRCAWYASLPRARRVPRIGAAWPNGKAAVRKTAIPGSTPGAASTGSPSRVSVRIGRSSPPVPPQHESGPEPLWSPGSYVVGSGDGGDRGISSQREEQPQDVQHRAVTTRGLCCELSTLP